MGAGAGVGVGIGGEGEEEGPGAAAARGAAGEGAQISGENKYSRLYSSALSFAPDKQVIQRRLSFSCSLFGH